jgi:hypothetical protein
MDPTEYQQELIHKFGLGSLGLLVIRKLIFKKEFLLIKLEFVDISNKKETMFAIK